jgi:hypothetical protein
MVRPKARVSKVLMVGPLVPFADDLSATLAAAGYTPLSVVNQLRLLAAGLKNFRLSAGRLLCGPFVGVPAGWSSVCADCPSWSR